MRSSGSFLARARCTTHRWVPRAACPPVHVCASEDQRPHGHGRRPCVIVAWGNAPGRAWIRMSVLAKGQPHEPGRRCAVGPSGMTCPTTAHRSSSSTEQRMRPSGEFGLRPRIRKRCHQPGALPQATVTSGLRPVGAVSAGANTHRRAAGRAPMSTSQRTPPALVASGPRQHPTCVVQRAARGREPDRVFED